MTKKPTTSRPKKKAAIVPLPKRGKKGGNPPHVPDEASFRLVSSMAAAGITQDEIALVVGIDPKTLRLHYRVELDTSAIKANAKIGQTLFQQAVAGNTSAAIWWSKSRMGWKETNVNEQTGRNGGPIDNKFTIEFIDATPKGK